MQIKYKFLEVNPQENTVLVRFFTDELSEEDLCGHFIEGVPKRNEDGSITRCRSDYNIALPIPAPTGAALEEYIIARAPTEWLATMGQFKNGNSDPTLAAIASAAGQEFVPGVTAPLNDNQPVVIPSDILGAAKARAKRTLNTYRERVLSAGVMYNGNRFDSDSLSVSRLTAVVSAVNAGVPLPDGFVWRSATNVDVPMTGADLTALLAAMMVRANEVYQTSWAKKAAVDAATTVDEVNAVTWTDAMVQGYSIPAAVL